MKIYDKVFKKNQENWNSETQIGYSQQAINDTIRRTLAETKKEKKELKEKIERLEDELLAYRRPRGTSVVNVREDERKKTLASVDKVIDECIKEEEFCMSNDKYDEQILEHTNQIEMAKKIKQKLGIK